MKALYGFPPGLMTKEVAAYYLGMSEREIDLLRETGELIPVGKGKRVKFTREELDAYREKLPERASS